MAYFLKFTQDNGKPITLNIDNIISIQPLSSSDDSCYVTSTYIGLNRLYCIKLKETYNEVDKALRFLQNYRKDK